MAESAAMRSGTYHTEVAMKSIVAVAVLSTGLALAAPVHAQEAAAKSAGCMNCHAVDTKKVGPAFKDVAKKYKGQADAADKLTAALKSGKGHPAVKASDAEIKGIVSWVLAM
jgi:cytochrome c